MGRLRANGNKFTIGERGREAARELVESQSPALRFARDCLIVTGDPNDYVPLAAVYDRYDHWAVCIEGLSSRERRNRDYFKSDLCAALMSRGVRHDRRRWHDPARPSERRGRLMRGFFGFKLKPEEPVPD